MRNALHLSEAHATTRVPSFLMRGLVVEDVEHSYLMIVESTSIYLATPTMTLADGGRLAAGV